MSGRNRSEEQAAWHAEMAAVNLARLRWVWLLAVALFGVFAACIPLLPALSGQDFGARVALDVSVGTCLFALGEWVRRRPAVSRWRARYAWLSMGFILVGQHTWYFFALPRFGQNSDYMLGVLVASVVVLAPPRIFGPLLVVNHVIFCAVLLTSGQPQTVIVAGVADGTGAVIIGALVAWFLYRARAADFFKTRALAATNAELREVMAIAAHDLRSPLLGLRDLLGLARREPEAQAGRLARALDVAGESCGGMVRLVSRLVEAHAAEESQGRLALVAQDLRGSCAAAVERLRATAETKEQRIALALPAAAATAEVDAGAFGQVLENLLGNALKFSPRGARIELALHAADGRDAWWIDVSDEGPGVPEEERAQLFRKFHRASARPTGGEASTGFGLFIVKTLTEGMHGRVSHLAREGGGSIFRLEFPRSGPVPDRAAAPCEEGSPYPENSVSPSSPPVAS